jgi:hypothetical protein
MKKRKKSGTPAASPSCTTQILLHGGMLERMHMFDEFKFDRRAVILGITLDTHPTAASLGRGSKSAP